MSSVTQYKPRSPEAAAMKILVKHRQILREWRTNKEDVLKKDSVIELIEKPPENSKLKNQLLEHTDIIPCSYMDYIFGIAKFPNNYPYEQFIKFVIEVSALIMEIRYVYLFKRWLQSGGTTNSAKTALNEFIGGLNLNRRRTPMKKSELHRAMSEFLLTHPKMLSWELIYNIHDEAVGKKMERPESQTSRLMFRYPAGKKKSAPAPDNLYPDRSPWKTYKKLSTYADSIGWSSDKAVSVYSQNYNDSFDMTQQRKLMRHYTGPRFTYVIDYMLAGRYPYLIAINMNTRKAYSVLSCLVEKYGIDNVYTPSTFNPKSTHCNRDIEQLMKQTTVKHLIMDGQSGWDSKETRAFLDKHGVTYKYEDEYTIDAETIQVQKPNRKIYNTSMVDRLMRTLRMMNYNVGNRNEIEPEVMQWLIMEYNRSPHGTLSKLLGYDVSPNEVDDDIDLETEIVKRIRAQNFAVTTSPGYDASGYVRVYNHAHNMDKVKPKLLPGKWMVVERENGLFKLRQNNNEIKVPRWMIKDVYG